MPNPPQNSSNFELPEEIAKKFFECLGDETEKLVRVMCFFSDTKNTDRKRYIQTLKNCFYNDMEFRLVVEKLAEHNEKTEDPLIQVIQNEIFEQLEDSPEKLKYVLDFFTEREEEITKKYHQSLAAVINNRKAFKSILDKLVEDLQKNYTEDTSYEGDENSSRQWTLNKIAKILKEDPNGLANVLRFLSDYDLMITKWFIQVLEAVKDNNNAFRSIVNNLVEYTHKFHINSKYLLVMGNIWNNLLKSTMINMKLITASTAYNFIGTLSKLPASKQIEIVELTIKAASSVALPTSTICSLNISFNNLLKVTTSKYGFAVSNGLLVAFLAFEAWITLSLWMENKISGKCCTKNIIDSCVGVAGGVTGGIAGAVAGTYVSPGIGTIFGAFIGGVGGSMLAVNMSDWFTAYFFDLPTKVAQENAYKFLELYYGASIDEINSSYKRLALKYNPDNGGNKENWCILQVSMGIITLSQGKI